MTARRTVIVSCDHPGCDAAVDLGPVIFPHADRHPERAGWTSKPTPPPSGAGSFFDYCPDHPQEAP